MDFSESSIDLMRTEASSERGTIDDVEQVPNSVQILLRIGRFCEFLSLFVDQSIPEILRYRIGHDGSGRDVLLKRPHKLAD
jgi:hypothetical protein